VTCPSTTLTILTKFESATFCFLAQQIEKFIADMAQYGAEENQGVTQPRQRETQPYRSKLPLSSGW
jgi:hypothetical protein